MKARFEFKFEDMWVGVFWRKGANQTEVWICLVPCFPLHIVLLKP